MRFLPQPVALCLAGAFVLSAAAHAQGPPRGFWPIPGQDSAHNQWQKAETDITTATVAKDFKFLWKLKLGKGPAKTSSFSEPLLFPGLITGRGFKDLALLADANTLYAVDSELGELVWQKDFKSSSASKACGNIQIVTEPPQVIHFGARRPATPKPATVPPPPPSEEPLPRDQRRVGVAAGGGYFGLRGGYPVHSDDYIHEQIMPNVYYYAPPVKFFPAPNGNSFGLNINDKVVY